MGAQDYLNEAQNNLDHADLLVDSAERRGRPPSYESISTALTRAGIAAQMATALAILEQTKAIQDHYAGEPYQIEADVNRRYPHLSPLPEADPQRPSDEDQVDLDAAEYDAQWVGMRRDTPTPFERAVASDEIRPDIIQDGHRVFRVGETVRLVTETSHLWGQGTIRAVYHNELGRELTVHFPEPGLTRRLDLWDVDLVEHSTADSLLTRLKKMV